MFQADLNAESDRRLTSLYEYSTLVTNDGRPPDLPDSQRAPRHASHFCTEPDGGIAGSGTMQGVFMSDDASSSSDEEGQAPATEPPPPEPEPLRQTSPETPAPEAVKFAADTARQDRARR